MKRVSVAALAVALLITSATTARADDVADCRNTGALLKTKPEKAVAACRRLAEKGQAWAQNNLGFLFTNGLGVSQDFEEAVEWYRKAAEQGLADAQNNLGVMYKLGLGLSEDFKEAVKWYRKAAEQGHGMAQYNLADMYRIGWGVSQDNVQAYMWYNLAAVMLPSGQERDTAAKNRDTIAQEMTPAQLKEAQRLAREWAAAHPQKSQ